MQVHKRNNLFWVVLLVLVLPLLAGCGPEHQFIKKVSFKDTQSISVIFAGPVDADWAGDKGNYQTFEKQDPDIQLVIRDITVSKDGKSVILHFDEALNQNQPHVLTISNIQSGGRSLGTAMLSVKKLYVGYLFSILIGAMIINNFVFTKYLGLCVFFGTSQKKSTAIGMGITFTIVIVVSAMTVSYTHLTLPTKRIV